MTTKEKKTTKERKPTSGYRLAWRQIIPSYDYCSLLHAHSATIFPEDDLDYLKAICVARNAGYRLQDGSPGLFHWVEWHDKAKGYENCQGTYWEEQEWKK